MFSDGTSAPHILSYLDQREELILNRRAREKQTDKTS